MNQFAELRKLGFVRAEEFLDASHERGLTMLTCLKNGFAGEYWIRTTKADLFEIVFRESTLIGRSIEAVKSMCRIDLSLEKWSGAISFGEILIDSVPYQLISIPLGSLEGA